MISLTAGDVLVNTLIDRGVDTEFGIPGDGINGLIEFASPAAGGDTLHPGSPRGGRRLRSMRLCEMDRAPWRYRDFGAGRNPSPERTL